MSALNDSGIFFLLLFAVAVCLGPVAGGLRASEVRVGAEVLLSDHRHLIEGKRLGVITNHGAIVGEKRLIDLLHEDPGVTIAVLFAPEHGIAGTADAGEAIPDGRDELTGAPVFSLYGQVRRPSREMLAGVDALVFDMQDIGARFYTRQAIMGRAMISAAEAGIPFLVLDRPNPLGGERVEGFIREDRFRSDIGTYPIPVTHGLTIGELARMIRGEGWHDGLEELELHVVETAGWKRNMLWTDTGLNWAPPSPNIPDFETALVYPGVCLFEGTSASEGRGTRRPFLQVGAPGVDAGRVAEELNRRGLSGVRFSPVTFTPESIPGMSREPKLLGTQVHGVRLEVVEARELEPVATGIHLLDVFYHALPAEARSDFFHPRGIRIRAGNETVHETIEQGGDIQAVIDAWQDDAAAFRKQREPYLLYE